LVFGQSDEEDEEYLYYEDEEEVEGEEAKLQNAASTYIPPNAIPETLLGH
jgi:protoheme IX farnesyltransferase